MKDRIVHTEGGPFVAVRPGDPFAGAKLTKEGAAEVNTTRYDVVAGSDRSVADKLASHLLHEHEKTGPVTQGILQKAKEIIDGDRTIYPGRRPR